MSEQDEVNEQARLNGMGAERELALMAKLEAATRARQQAQEALYAERDRHAATVKKMQADLEMRTDESVRYRGVLDATVIVIEEMRQEIESLQAGSGEVVAWQASDGGHSFISHRTHTTNPDYRAVYTIPLCVATPQPEPAPVAATSAMVPMKLVEINDVGLAPAVIKPFTPAQRRRLWDNSKEHHKDAANITGFERIVTLTERAHGIGLTVAASQQPTGDFDPLVEIARLVRTNDQLRERIAGLIQQAAQATTGAPSEPFGYFKAQPFGWTDCAETDDGAVALYERPNADGQREQVAKLLGTRKVLWDLLGECLPLLKVDAEFSTDYEGKEAIELLIEQIEAARSRVQSDELPQRIGP